MKTVSVDASTKTDGEIGHHAFTETYVEVGHDVSEIVLTETQVEI